MGCLRNKKGPLWSLAGQSEEHTTLRGGDFEPHVGIEITLKKLKNKVLKIIEEGDDEETTVLECGP